MHCGLRQILHQYQPKSWQLFYGIVLFLLESLELYRVFHQVLVKDYEKKF